MPRPPRFGLRDRAAATATRRLAASGARAWLINTGWTGGGYGTGRRIDIAATRRLVAAALSGELDAAGSRLDPHFGLRVPVAVAGIDSALLDPRTGWSDGAAYDRQAQRLKRLFADNFSRLGQVSPMAAAAE